MARHECDRCGLSAGDLPEDVFDDDALDDFFDQGLCVGCRELEA